MEHTSQKNNNTALPGDDELLSRVEKSINELDALGVAMRKKYEGLEEELDRAEKEIEGENSESDESEMKKLSHDLGEKLDDAVIKLSTKEGDKERDSDADIADLG